MPIIASQIVSGHRAPHLAAIGPAHVQKYASPLIAELGSLPA